MEKYGYELWYDANCIMEDHGFDSEADGSDALAQENGYTLEECLQMEDAKFFLD